MIHAIISPLSKMDRTGGKRYQTRIDWPRLIFNDLVYNRGSPTLVRPSLRNLFSLSRGGSVAFGTFDSIPKEGRVVAGGFVLVC